MEGPPTRPRIVELLPVFVFSVKLVGNEELTVETESIGTVEDRSSLIVDLLTRLNQAEAADTSGILTGGPERDESRARRLVVEIDADTTLGRHECQVIYLVPELRRQLAEE
jgi:hypothetical protein